MYFFDLGADVDMDSDWFGHRGQRFVLLNGLESEGTTDVIGVPGSVAIAAAVISHSLCQTTNFKQYNGP